MSIDSGDISDQSLKLSKIVNSFGHFFALPNFKGVVPHEVATKLSRLPSSTSRGSFMPNIVEIHFNLLYMEE